MSPGGVLPKFNDSIIYPNPNINLWDKGVPSNYLTQISVIICKLIMLKWIIKREKKKGPFISHIAIFGGAHPNVANTAIFGNFSTPSPGPGDLSGYHGL